jgi:hypothetical protein
MPQEPWKKYAQLNTDGTETPPALEVQPKPWEKYAQTAPPETQTVSTAAGSSLLSNVAGLATGAAKGVLSTVKGASDVITSLSPPLKRFNERFSIDTGINLQPQNTGEQIGKAAEQIGEFFVPGGAVARGAKALGGASKLGQFAARTGLEALSAGGVTAAQTGGDPGSVKTAAGIAAAVPIVGKAVEPIAAATKGLLSQRIAPRIVNSIIKPAKKEFRFGRDPGAEVAVQGLKARTMEGLEREIVKRSEGVGKQIDRTLSLPANAAKQIDIVPLVTQPIDDAIKAAKVDGNQALVSRLESFKKGQLQERFGLTQSPKALRLNPLDSRKLKTDIGKSTRWTEDPIEGSLNKVRQEIYRNLNTAIDTAVPGVKGMNRSYGNLLSAEKAVQSRNEILKKANFVGLSDLGVGVSMGLVTAALSGELSTNAAINAITAGAVSKGLKSPSMTFLAARLAKLSPTERSQIAERVVPILRNLALASNATAGRESE